MKTEKASAKISEVLGQTLPKPIPFDYGFEAFETPGECKDAGEWPNDKEIVDLQNEARKRKAYAKVRAEKIAEIEKDLRSTPEFKLAELKKALVEFAGMSAEDAEVQARKNLGL